MNKQKLLIFFCCLSFFISCSSYQKFRDTEEFEYPSYTYNSTYLQTWQGVISTMKKFELDSRDQVSGHITTRWINNTDSYNFINVLGFNKDVRDARFQLKIVVTKGFLYSREVTRVTIFKRQLIERNVLQGFQEIPSDGILEKTILYRIQRLLAIENRLKEIQIKKNQEEIRALDAL